MSSSTRLATLILGCSWTLALASAQSIEPVAPAASAAPSRIIVFNDSGKTLVPSRQKVTVDGQVAARLARKTYATLELPAGRHVVRPEPYLWKQEVIVDLQPGTTRYVVVAYKPERSWAAPLAGAPLVMMEITEQEATPLLAEMQAAPTD